MRTNDSRRRIQIGRTCGDIVGRRVLRRLWLCFRQAIRRPVAERFEFKDRANDERASLKRRVTRSLFWKDARCRAFYFGADGAAPVISVAPWLCKDGRILRKNSNAYPRSSP